MKRVSYALGLGIGQQLLQMGAKSLDINEMAQAIKDVVEGNELRISHRDAQPIVQQFFKEQEERIQREKSEKGRLAKAEGERFLAENARREGVVTLPSGLQYMVLTEGLGKSPKATDRVVCHYEGSLTDGTVFDSSVRRGEPATFGLSQVITGWTEGVQLMREGSKYRFFIPYRLGYGESGAGEMIPPYAALVFDVELLKVL